MAERLSSAAASNHRVTEHLSLARSIARQFARRGPEPYEDLAQVASVGLIKADRSYDSSFGDFGPYARRTILGELKHYLRDCGWSIRPPRRVQELCLRLSPATEALEQRLGRRPSEAELARETGATLAEVRAARVAQLGWRHEPIDMEESLEPRLARKDPGFETVELREIMEQLGFSERDLRLLTLRAQDELSQSELARRVGVSQMQVSRDLRRLEQRLRRAFEANPWRARASA